MRGSVQIVHFRHREGHVLGADARPALSEIDQPIFIAIDERPEENAAHDAENGGIGADAERERDNDGGGETFGAQQRSEADSHLSTERRTPIEPPAVPHAPHRVARGRNVAKLTQRSQTSRLRILSTLNPLLHAEREVPADLFVEFAVVRPHGSLLGRRRVHDAPDRLNQLRPAILFARELRLSC
jgi:hypothetical protein